MKFISKIKNYRLVLRPGIPGNKLSGQIPVPQISAYFQDGILTVNDEDIIKLLLESPKLKVDFVSADNNDATEFTTNRNDSEPKHNIIEMDRGCIGKNLNPKQGINLTPVSKELIKETAKEMAKVMFEEFLKDKKNEDKDIESTSTPIEEKKEYKSDKVKTSTRATDDRTQTLEDLRKEIQNEEKEAAEVEKEVAEVEDEVLEQQKRGRQKKRD